MEFYWGIKEQRKSICAPVDTMGCEVGCPDAPAREKEFSVLVSLMLSSQTKDEVTHKAMTELKKKLGEITPEKMQQAEKKTIHQAIRSVGYHNKKTEYLQEVARRLRNRHLPASIEECVALPGVGKKMGFLYLQHALGVTAGIGVDTHVHRISNRIGLVQTRTPEQTRVALEKIVPRSEWGEINKVLVGFGQKVCLSRQPRCEMCSISNRCPTSETRARKNNSRCNNTSYN